ncbi:MAG TPA: peptide deformylase [Gammaproteobacteria bacterium]|nr:peptide deformylase [Gammaproteobacteria bacterium]
MQQTIIQLGQPVLRKPARMLSLEEIKTEEFQNLIERMKDTMRKAPGVGLAAPQIGIDLQVAVIEDRKEYTAGFPEEILRQRNRVPVDFHVIINPVLTITDPTEMFFFEGCLSIAGICRVTPRARSVRVECLDENGDKKIIEATGWYARILQHEIDHLKGKLFIDHADERTEITINEETRKKWLQASHQEVYDYYTECLKN